jgi:hypothetical protein
MACFAAVGELDVSGDISSPPGSGLDAAPRPGDERGLTATAPEPSLVRVLGTTVRLWWRRRVLRVQDGARIGALRWTALIVVVLLVAGGAAAGAVAASARTIKPVPLAPPTQRLTRAQVQAQANEQAAGTWLAAQVAATTLIGCDPGMCGFLQAAGYPMSQDVVFLPGADVPGGAALVVSTPALRTQAAAALTGTAPEVIASFGAGREAVQVLVTSDGSPSAFAFAAQAAVVASQRTGRSLARDKGLHLSAAARLDLTGGMVDRRLLVILQKLVAARQVDVTGFADVGPGATSTAQFRSVTIAGLSAHALRSTLKLLRGERPPYRPSVQEVSQPGGGTELIIQVSAPNLF